MIDNAPGDLEGKGINNNSLTRIVFFTSIFIIGVIFFILGIWLIANGVTWIHDPYAHSSRNSYTISSYVAYMAFPGLGFLIYGFLSMSLTLVLFNRDNDYFDKCYSDLRSAITNHTRGVFVSPLDKALLLSLDWIENKTFIGTAIAISGAQQASILLAIGVVLMVAWISNLTMLIAGIVLIIIFVAVISIWVTLKERKHPSPGVNDPKIRDILQSSFGNGRYRRNNRPWLISDNVFTSSTSDEPGGIKWDQKYPLINNLTAWKELLLGFMLSECVILFLLLAVILAIEVLKLATSAYIIITFLGLIVIFMPFLAYFNVLFMAWKSIARHGADAMFFINDDGIGSVVGFAPYGSAFSFISVLLMNKGKYFEPYMNIYQSHLAEWVTCRHVRWADIRKVKADHSKRKIYLKGRPLSLPVLLYCDRENFSQALELIEKRVSGNIIQNYGETLDPAIDNRAEGLLGGPVRYIAATSVIAVGLTSMAIFITIIMMVVLGIIHL